MWKLISNKPNEKKSQFKATEIRDDKIRNKKRSITKKSTNHILQRKGQKKVDYRHKTFDGFRLMIVEPP